MFKKHQTVDTARSQRGLHPTFFLRLTRTQLAVGAMAFSGIMLSLPTLPASADVVVDETAGEPAPQSLVVPVAVQDPEVVDREEFGIVQFTVVQSPVAVGTRINSPFGYRVPPCRGCSSYHRGVDYGAGAGTAVRAMSDGVVTEASTGGGGLGVYLKIQHKIDGQTITSTYAHLQRGSMPYRVGNTVPHGAVVGKVGNTGQSTGAHLYFEIRLGGQHGQAVNPVPWLNKHRNV